MLLQKNTKKQGDVGLGAAIDWACQAGYTVSLPLTDSQEYDLVVDDGDLRRVQVKTTRGLGPSGKYVVQLKTCGGNRSGMNIKRFDHSAVDILFVLTDAGQRYVIPTSEFTSDCQLTLTEKYATFVA